MKNHAKIYFDKSGYLKEDFIPCEVCESKAVDINHIQARGMGGSKTRDYFSNLMAVCRECHELLGDVSKFKKKLYLVHFLHFPDYKPSNEEVINFLSKLFPNLTIKELINKKLSELCRHLK